MFSCVFSLPYVQLVLGTLLSTFSDQKSLLHYSFPNVHCQTSVSVRTNQSLHVLFRHRALLILASTCGPPNFFPHELLFTVFSTIIITHKQVIFEKWWNWYFYSSHSVKVKSFQQIKMANIISGTFLNLLSSAATIGYVRDRRMNLNPSFKIIEAPSH